MQDRHYYSVDIQARRDPGSDPNGSGVRSVLGEGGWAPQETVTCISWILYVAYRHVRVVD